MTTEKLKTLEALLAQANNLRAEVFRVREPGEDELRRAQGLLSEVRDLIEEAIKKAPVVKDKTADQIRAAAVEAVALTCADSRDNVGDAKVLEATAQACTLLGLDEVGKLTLWEFQVIRRAVVAAMVEPKL